MGVWLSIGALSIHNMSSLSRGHACACVGEACTLY